MIRWFCDFYFQYALTCKYTNKTKAIIFDSLAEENMYRNKKVSIVQKLGRGGKGEEEHISDPICNKTSFPEEAM